MTIRQALAKILKANLQHHKDEAMEANERREQMLHRLNTVFAWKPPKGIRISVITCPCGSDCGGVTFGVGTDMPKRLSVFTPDPLTRPDEILATLQGMADDLAELDIKVDPCEGFSGGSMPTIKADSDGAFLTH